MGQGQSGWIAIAVATIPGAVLAVLGWLAKRRIEGAQARAIESTSALDALDRAMDRLEKENSRKDAELAKKDQQIADLKADLHLVESMLLEERNRRKKTQ